MNKTTKVVIGLVLVVLVIWGVSKSSTNKKTSGTQTPIKIGVITVLSGDFASYGEDMRNGIQSAAVPGVEFVFEDDKCEPKDAVGVFQKMTEIDGIKFFIGPGCGSPQEAVSPLVASKNVVAVAPSAASRGLFASSKGGFFNIQYSLEDESKFIAESLYASGIRKVSLIVYGNAFSKAHADSFRKNFKGEIVTATMLQDDNQNILTELTKIRAATPDAIYSPDMSFFFADGLGKMKQLNMTIPVYTTYVAELPAARKLVEGVKYSFPGNLSGDKGATYELSKEAAQLLATLVSECKSDVSCVKEKINSSGQFDEFGANKRPIVLKQIKGGIPVQVH
ncbi:MAG: extracellular ligand-binding receptor [Parcubacteria group bacterium]|nr:extracellular ligand-binding receptor [Parcubacteria group bacterium]